MFGRKKGKKERYSIADAVSRTLELPVDVLEGLPQLELLGNREAYIEHCLGVLEYNDQIVRLNTGRMILKFTGRRLTLKCLSGDSMTVQGYFTALEFSTV